MQSAVELKEMHDELLANMPDGTVHDAETCPLCGIAEQNELDASTGGDMSTETFSQEDLDAAIAAAVKPLEDEIKKLALSQEEQEIEERIAKEKAELEIRLADIQTQLDSAVLEAAEAKKTHDEFVAALEAAQIEEETKAELARKRGERIAVVRDVASFPDEYVEKNADRWAALADEDFEALTSDWKAISTKGTSGSIPNVTAMVASRESDSGFSPLREMFDLTVQGFDPKTL